MTIDEITAQTVAYLKTLPDGTEMATSDALKASCGFDFDPNGEYLVGNTSPVDCAVFIKQYGCVSPK